MSQTQTIGFKRQPRRAESGHAIPEGSDIPAMRPRTGPRGTDQKLAALLDEALQDLAITDCGFWACEGPSRPRSMCTCRKCWSMRQIATVKASLEARSHQSS